MPTITGNVTSARLRMSTGLISGGPQQTYDYQLTLLASEPDAFDDFAAVETGKPIATRSFLPDDSSKLLSLDFNAAGIAALTSGGTFLVGGWVTNLQFDTSPSGPSDEGAELGVFGFSEYLPVGLESDTAVPAVPELASRAMLITGFGLAGAALRRRRTAIA